MGNEQNKDNTNNPMVGGPATIASGSDRYAGKVISVSKSGFKVCVEYVTSGGLNGERITCYRDRNGRYYDGRSRVTFNSAETCLDRILLELRLMLR